MGIDVYMSWKGQTDEEERAQFTGFSTAGNAGYLREAYHGAPYATQVLVPEAFNESGDEDGAQIPAAVLADRAEATIKAVIDRARLVHHLERDDPETQRRVRSFVDFIELAKRKETETGEPVRIYASW